MDSITLIITAAVIVSALIALVALGTFAAVLIVAAFVVPIMWVRYREK